MNKKKRERVKVLQRPCHVAKASSHLNTEVKKHWVSIILGWEIALELQVAQTKNQGWASIGSLLVMQVDSSSFKLY